MKHRTRIIALILVGLIALSLLPLMLSAMGIFACTHESEHQHEHAHSEPTASTIPETTLAPDDNNIDEVLKHQEVYLLSQTTVLLKDARISFPVLDSFQPPTHASILTVFITKDSANPTHSSNSLLLTNLFSETNPMSRFNAADGSCPLATCEGTQWELERMNGWIVTYRIPGEIEMDNMKVYLVSDDIKVEKELISSPNYSFTDSSFTDKANIVCFDDTHHYLATIQKDNTIHPAIQPYSENPLSSVVYTNYADTVYYFFPLDTAYTIPIEDWHFSWEKDYNIKADYTLQVIVEANPEGGTKVTLRHWGNEGMDEWIENSNCILMYVFTKELEE